MPGPMRLRMKNQRPTNRATGMIHDNRSRRKVLSICPVTTTPCSARSRARSGATRVVMNIGRPSTGVANTPWMKRSDTATYAILPSSR
ncbi:hypothetical protein D9M68_926860 [compost metagenome]